MELLQNLWNVLITEDENLSKCAYLSFAPIEIYVTMKLFTAVLNIKATNKQKTIYVIIMTILSILSGTFIDRSYSVFIHILITPILTKLIFKVSLLKSILSVIIPTLITVLLESLYIKLCYTIFGINTYQCANTIIYRIPFMIFVYLTIFGLAKFINSIRINLDSFEDLDSFHKRLLVINLIFILICICAQFYLFIFYNATLPLYITLISLVSLITYSIISFYSVTKFIKLETTQKNLEQMQLYNKTLEILYSNTRAFKHDFSNIMTAFGGLIYSEDIKAIQNYYNKIIDECHINNNLSTLNPKLINNPAIYNILANKYYKADELGIKINLEVFINLNNLKMDIYDFSRVLGILLDNAIEAASKCTEKIINITIHDIKLKNYQVLTIENTYLNKDVNLTKIFEKGYTSKTEEEGHGIGLWQVSKILKKSSNVVLDTSKSNNLFKQELVIYYI